MVEYHAWLISGFLASKVVLEWLKQTNIMLLESSAQSPDLNPIKKKSSLKAGAVPTKQINKFYQHRQKESSNV